MDQKTKTLATIFNEELPNSLHSLEFSESNTKKSIDESGLNIGMLDSVENAENPIVISGIGITTTLGCSLKDFWRSLQLIKKDQFASKISDVEEKFDYRFLKKIDKFTLLAIESSKQSLEMAKLTCINNNRVGMIICNEFGGWSYVEPQMYSLYLEGMDNINPYVATAWFPAAPQGEISISLGIEGYSKTFSADSVSVGYAIEHSIYLVKNGYLDQVLLGGVEAPLTPLVSNYYYSGLPTSQIDKISRHTDLGEGGAMFVIEKKLSANERKCKVFAKILGVGVGPDLSTAINYCFINSGKNISNIECILLNASGNKKNDENEITTLSKIFFNKKDIFIASYKDKYGNLVSANQAIDLVISCLIIDNKTIPPSNLYMDKIYRYSGFKIPKKPVCIEINNILLISIDNYGQSSCVLISS